MEFEALRLHSQQPYKLLAKLLSIAIMIFGRYTPSPSRFIR